MRNLIRFVLKHQNFFLFFLLEAIAFTLLVNHNAYHGAAFFNFSTSISGGFHEKIDGITHYFELGRENELLQRENAKLKAALFSMETPDSTQIQNLADTSHRYSVIPAKVISLSTANSSNYTLIDRGRQDSLLPGMGVISDYGVVGVIKATSEHYAVVMPIINHNYQVSSKLQNTNYFGSLSWDGVNYKYAQLNAIEKHAKIARMDSIVTTGFSRTFPEGILIGTIKDYLSHPDEDFYTIDVDLATNFKTLSSVYVIVIRDKDEMEKLIKEEAND